MNPSTTSTKTSTYSNKSNILNKIVLTHKTSKNNVVTLRDNNIDTILSNHVSGAGLAKVKKSSAADDFIEAECFFFQNYS